MKQLLIASNIILFAIVLILSCNRSQDSRQAKHDSTCGLCGDYSESSPPEGLMPPELIKQLSMAYKEDTRKSLVSESDSQDALSLVFDLNKVKNFIWQMEHGACNSKCLHGDTLGIRFYYIKYVLPAMGATDELKKLYEKNPDRHSLAMIPAYLKDGNWYDFDYNHPNRSCNYPETKKELLVPPGAALLSIPADNHGGLAPPPGNGVYPTTQQ